MKARSRLIRLEAFLVGLAIGLSSCTATKVHEARPPTSSSASSTRSSATVPQNLWLLWTLSTNDKRPPKVYRSHVDGSDRAELSLGTVGPPAPDEWDRTFALTASPDGHYLARSNRHVLEIASADRPTRFHRIVDAGRGGGLFGPTWAPDSSMLAYQLTNGCCLDTGTFRQTLWVVHRNGNENHRLRSGDQFIVPDAFDIPHNRLFVHEAGEGPGTGFSAISLTTGAVLKVFEKMRGDTGLVYRPDLGRAFYLDYQSSTHLFEYSLRTNTERTIYRAPNLTDANGNHSTLSGPIAIPGDRRLIIGFSDPATHRETAYLLDPADDSTQLLLAPDRLPCAQWQGPVSPDGRFLVVAGNNCDVTGGFGGFEGYLWVLDIRNGTIYRFFEPTYVPTPSPHGQRKPGEPAAPPTLQDRAAVLGWLVIS